MAADVLKFVDAISASPTTRLDMTEDGGAGWRLTSFVANPPRLRRAASNNAMRDGGIVSSSSYENRVLTITFSLVNAAQDTNATEIQKLARELDRETNLLKWQPNGLTKPVFFKTFRSDVTTLDYLWSAKAFHNITIEILAEPFALGLRETISSGTIGTVNNDPASSNGCYFDLTGIIGDVAAPMVMVDTATPELYAVLAVRQRGTVTNLPTVIQCESLTMGTDTAVAANDPVLSGAGSNRARTTFATVTVWDTRLTYTTTTSATARALRGTFRVLITVKRASAVATLTARTFVSNAIAGTVTGEDVVIPASTSRQVVDLGLVTFGVSDDQAADPYISLAINAKITGAENVDWDCIQLIPADECSATISLAGFSTNDVVIDAESDRVYAVAAGGDLFSTGTRETYAPDRVMGGLPSLIPNQTNRIFYIRHDASAGCDKSLTSTVTVYYMPRYLFIRPSAT